MHQLNVHYRDQIHASPPFTATNYTGRRLHSSRLCCQIICLKFFNIFIYLLFVTIAGDIAVVEKVTTVAKVKDAVESTKPQSVFRQLSCLGLN